MNEKKVHIPITLTKNGTNQSQIASVTTGSILIYKSPDNKNYLVLTGEVVDDKILITTPGGKMDANRDADTFETVLREIGEETGIPKSDLLVVNPINTQKSWLTYFSIDDFNVANNEVVGAAKLFATMLFQIDPKRELSFVVVYKFITHTEPIATSESPISILVPTEKLSLLKKAKYFRDLVQENGVLLNSFGDKLEALGGCELMLLGDIQAYIDGLVSV